MEVNNKGNCQAKQSYSTGRFNRLREARPQTVPHSAVNRVYTTLTNQVSPVVSSIFTIWKAMPKLPLEYETNIASLLDKVEAST